MYLELECPGKPPKGRIFDDDYRARRKFRQLARYKRRCAVTLYAFEMNRLRVVARTLRGPTPR